MTSLTDPRAAAEALVRRYYAAFNAADVDAMVACLADGVAHDVNQGERRTGAPMFRAFMEKMNRCYGEQLDELVVMASADGRRAAAEFIVHGVYLATDAGLPPAANQRYVLPAGAFFTLDSGRIARIATHYNLADWMRQVTGQ